MSIRQDSDVVIAAWLRGEAQAGAPDRLLSAIRAQIEVTHQRRSRRPAWRFRDMNTALKLAIGTATVVIVAVAVIGNTVNQGTAGVGGSPFGPPPTAITTPTMPSSATPADPTPSAIPSEVDRGWPTWSSNPSGRYSWDPDRRAAEESRLQGRGVFGLMSHDESHIAITLSTPTARPVSPPAASDGSYGPGSTVTTVGGYPATYQELPVKQGDHYKHPDCGGDRCVQRVWIIDINGMPVTITVDPGPTASVADLAEATAVIDSIRIEQTSRTGFTLTFELPAGWHS